MTLILNLPSEDERCNLVTQVIMPDAGPLGLITNPKLSVESESCTRWLQTHITSDSRIIIPEISDYEVRRELLQANKTKGISRLDDLAESIEYLPKSMIGLNKNVNAQTKLINGSLKLKNCLNNTAIDLANFPNKYQFNYIICETS